MRGGLAEALGPNGDRTFVPVIMNMLRNSALGCKRLDGIFKLFVLYGSPPEFKDESMQMALNEQENLEVRYAALQLLG